MMRQKFESIAEKTAKTNVPTFGRVCQACHYPKHAALLLCGKYDRSKTVVEYLMKFLAKDY